MSVKAKPLRTYKMSRNLSRHTGVSCDACGKSSFSGKRYKCLTCYDFDLCAECFESGEAGTSRHSTSHPMQCILTRVESELYFGGETQVMDSPQSFTCPLCGQVGLSEAELRDHVSKKHAESAVLQEVICPVCAAYPNGDPNHLTDDLSTHLTVEHRALEQDSASVAQSRVRRLIGRRRAGLDRYVSALSREMGQESVDPIADMLSQLTGQSASSGNSGGGGASGRRDYYPPHIQQLLEQERHSYDHRASPLRRPVYRKVMVGGGAPPLGYEGSPLPINLNAGHLLDTPHSERGVGLGVGGLDRLSRVELLSDTSSSKKDSDKNLTSAGDKESPFLLANYNLPEPSGAELEELKEKRRHMSRFVQELLLSTLTSSSSSSSSDSSTGNSDEETDSHKQSPF